MVCYLRLLSVMYAIGPFGQYSFFLVCNQCQGDMHMMKISIRAIRRRARRTLNLTVSRYRVTYNNPRCFARVSCQPDIGLT